MEKKAFFYIDDVIWAFRDLTKEKPESMFLNPFMAVLKKAHDEYGLAVQLHVFYRSDFYYGSEEFTLADMTDKYKEEWEKNSDWLKINFHAKQEFPDYPYINADYDDVKSDYEAMAKEVKRFASEKNLGRAMVPHWTVISKDGARAVADCGVKLLSLTSGSERFDYDGDASSLPYGHVGRYLQNKKPETKLYVRETKDVAISRALAGYNYISDEQAKEMSGTFKYIYNEETKVNFFRMCNTQALNLLSVEEIKDAMQAVVGCEYVGTMIHEQYFYPEYYAYQPDYAEKIYTMAKILYENGYTFFFPDELV